MVDRSEKHLFNPKGVKILKNKQMIQLALIVIGIFMLVYGVSRGEAAVVLSKAIKICLECVGIG